MVYTGLVISFLLRQIENYSNMLLADGQVEFDCTANKENNMERFKELGDIQPRRRELLEVSNGAGTLVSTCGSLSWQIKQPPNGSEYLVDISKGKGLRVGLTWNVPWTASSSCGEGKHNQITVHTFNNEVTR